MLISRRDALKTISTGFGYVALSGLTTQQALAETRNPLSPKTTHHTPRAKRVIFLCMRGGPAQVDTFDYKPIREPVASTVNRGGRGRGRAGSQLRFNQCGESGIRISEAFPHLSQHADDLCLINSMWTDVPNHPQSFLLLHTGDFRFPRPSMGSWVLYGLGTENQNLPGFITINPPTRVGGAQNYASGFLPPIYQGTSIGHIGAPIATANIGNVTNNHLSPTDQRQQLNLIQSMNQNHLQRQQSDPRLESVIESLELGFRMQESVPQVMDLSNEPQSVIDMYGVGQTRRSGRCLDDDFGRQCLLARRFAEAGVRYIEVCHSNWDQHGNHTQDVRANSTAIDKPIAALITDLKQRDMLKDTLIVWGGEFGRTPLYAGRNGSGHNSAGFTMWMAGGGVRGGMNYGSTDETGARAVENRVHIHDLHATMLHLLGLDHEQLTYRYSGRDFRLTDVYGNVVRDIIA